MRHSLQRDKRNGVYFVWIRREGAKRYFTLGTSRKAAEKSLTQLEEDIAAGKVPFTEQETTVVTSRDGTIDMRIEEVAVRHLEWVKTNRSPGTFKIRQHYVLQFLGFMGEAMLSEVTRIKLEEFHAWAKAGHSRSENGGNEALSAVKTMLLWGQEMELYTLPFRKFPKMEHTPPETRRVFDEDLDKILVAAVDDFGEMLLFGFLTGLRPKELMQAEKAQILMDGSGKPYILIQRHKTSRSRRTPRPRSVPLCPDAYAIVQRQLAKHPETNLIFLNGRGTPYTRYSYKTRLRRLCLRAKTSRIFTPYCMRHTFASLASDGGEETTSLSKLMGHASERTLQRYVTNTHEHHHNAVKSLQDRIRDVRLRAENGRKCATECATEKRDEKRTCDTSAASP